MPLLSNMPLFGLIPFPQSLSLPSFGWQNNVNWKSVLFYYSEVEKRLLHWRSAFDQRFFPLPRDLLLRRFPQEQKLIRERILLDFRDESAEKQKKMLLHLPMRCRGQGLPPFVAGSWIIVKKLAFPGSYGRGITEKSHPRECQLLGGWMMQAWCWLSSVAHLKNKLS